MDVVDYAAWTTEELDRLRGMLAAEGAGPEETDAVAREIRRRESAAAPALADGRTRNSLATSSHVARIELDANVVKGAIISVARQAPQYRPS
jgi:hypothetical protein